MVTEAPVVFRCLLNVNDGADHKARGGSIICNQINQRVCVFQRQNNPAAYRQGLTPEGEDGNGNLGRHRIGIGGTPGAVLSTGVNACDGDASLVGGNGDEVPGGSAQRRADRWH